MYEALRGGRAAAAPGGTEIPVDAAELWPHYVANDSLIYVTIGEDSAPQAKKGGTIKNALEWAEVPTGGRISARGAPGKGTVKEWADQGATTVVTLLRDDEIAFSGIEAACKCVGLRWVGLPLSGKRAVSGDMEQRQEYDHESLRRIPEVSEMLLKGDSVVVHCAAGMHRTGVVCYLAVRHAGVSPSETLAVVQRTREVTHNELLKQTHKNPVCLAELAEAEFGAGLAEAEREAAMADLFGYQAAHS